MVYHHFDARKEMLITGAVLAAAHKMRSKRKKRHGKPKTLGTWRKYVLLRDGMKCDICEKKSKRNHAHHLYDKEHYPTKALQVSNGITLCPKHHRDFHAWNGGTRKRCRPKEYEMYKRKSAYMIAKATRIAIATSLLATAIYKYMGG